MPETASVEPVEKWPGRVEWAQKEVEKYAFLLRIGYQAKLVFWFEGGVMQSRVEFFTLKPK